MTRHTFIVRITRIAMILGVFVLSMNLLPNHPNAKLSPTANAQAYEPWKQLATGTWIWVPQDQCDLVWADVLSASSPNFLTGSQGRGGRNYYESEIEEL